MCGVTLRDRKTSAELRQRLGIVSVCDRVSQGRLICFGHVERKEEGDWVSACRDMIDMIVAGERGRGRGRKTWKECVADDMRKIELRREDAQDRDVWRSSFWETAQPVQALKHISLNDDDYDLSVRKNLILTYSLGCNYSFFIEVKLLNIFQCMIKI